MAVRETPDARSIWAGRLALSIVVAGLGLSIIALAWCIDTGSRIGAAKAYCAQLVERVESYRESHGEYPPRIDDVDLPTEPPPDLIDLRSVYSRMSKQSYVLAFSTPGGNGLGYDPSKGEWKRW